MILIDNFLTEESLQQLNDWDLWVDMTGKYSWYDKGEPKNIWESFIHYTANRLDVFDNVEGFEYWGNANVIEGLDDMRGLRWHTDKDETTDALHCDYSVIFYGYPHKMWGGMLEFAVEETLSEVERFAPRYNRIVYNDEADRMHRVSRVWAGNRASFVFSGWSEKPPLFKDKDVVSIDEVNGTYNGYDGT